MKFSEFSIVTQVKNQLQNWYISETHTLLNSFDCPQWFGVIVIICSQYEIFQFNFNKKYYQNELDLSVYQNNQNISYFILDYWDFSLKKTIFFTAFTVSIILCAYIILKGSLFLCGYKIPNLMILTVIFKIYPYLIFIPSFYASLCVTDEYIIPAVINMTLSFFIGYFLQNFFDFSQKKGFYVISNDFDYRFIPIDSLARRNSSREIIFLLSQTLALVLVKYAYNEILPFVGFSYNFIKLIFHFQSHPFSDFLIEKIEFGLTSLNLCLSIIFMIGQAFTTKFDYPLMMIICSPISIATGISIIHARITYLMNKFSGQVISTYSNTQSKSLQFQEIDLYLRYLYSQINCSPKAYLTSKYTLFLDEIIADHNLNCEMFPDCFCSAQIKPSTSQPMSKDDFLSDQTRKKYFHHYFLTIFEEQLRKSKGKSIRHPFFFSYIAFLVNAMKNQMLSFREILKVKLSKSNQNDLQFQQKIHYFLQLAFTEFNVDPSTQQLDKKTLESQNIIEILNFDEKLDKSTNLYRQCLEQKQTFLEKITKDYINLLEFEQIASQLSKKRDQLQSQLLELLQINNTNYPLNSICEGFQDCLSISNPFQHVIYSIGKNSRNKNTIPLYSNDSAAVFITMLEDIGKILKVTKNFKDIVPLVENSQSAVGKNIKFMMSDEIAVIHDKILMRCLKQKHFNSTLKPYPLMIGKNNHGYALSYEMKIQMCLVGDSDLGACAWIKQISNISMYMQTSSVKDEMKIILSDERFAEIFFKERITQNEMRKVYLSRLAPMLPVLIEKEKKGQTYETLIVLPNSFSDASKKRDLNDELFINKFMKQNLLLMRFNAYPQNTHYLDFIQLQVLSVKELLDVQQRKDALKNLAFSIKEFAESSLAISNMPKVLLLINSYFSNKDSISSGMKYAKNDRTINQSSNSKILDIETTDIFLDSKANIGKEQVKRRDNDKIITEIKDNIQMEPQIFNYNKNQADFLVSQEQLPILESQSESENEQSVADQADSQIQQQKQLKFHQKDRISNKTQSKGLREKQTTLSDLDQIKRDNSIRPVSNSDNLQTIQRQDHSYKVNLNQNQKQNINSPSSQDQLNIFSFPDNHNQDNNIINNNKNNEIISMETFPLSPASARPLMMPLSSHQEQKENIVKQLTDIQNKIIISSNSQTQLNPTQLEGNSKVNSSRLQQQQLSSFYEIPDQNIQIDQEFVSSGAFNDQEEKKEDEFMKNVDENESSKKTNNSYKSSQKALILRSIKIKKHSGGLQIINYIGLISLLTVASLNLMSFLILQSSNSTQNDNFAHVFWCYDLKRYTGYVLGVQELYRSTVAGYYALPAPYVAAFVPQIKNIRNLIFSGHLNLTKEMAEGDPDQIVVFKKAQDYQIDLYWQNIMTNQITSIIQLPLTYKILQWNFYGYNLNTSNDPMGYNLQLAYANYDGIQNSLDQIQASNIQYYKDEVDSNKTVIIVELIVICFVTGALSLSIVPFYINSQQEKENILKLFSTFSVDTIISMMTYVSFHREKLDFLGNYKAKFKLHKSGSTQYQPRNNINSNKRFSRSQKLSNNYISSHLLSTTELTKTKEGMKKRNISKTSSIQKISKTLIPGIIICLCCALFNPLAVYVVSNQQVDTFQSTLSFLSVFDYLEDNVCQMFGLKYVLTYLMYSDPTSPRIDGYIQKLQNFQTQSGTFYSQMLDEFSNYENTNFYQQEWYDNFFLPSFKGNICNVVNQTTMNLRYITFVYNNCLTANNQVFTKGLFVASKASLLITQTFIEAIVSKNAVFFKTALVNMQKNLNIINEFTFFSYFGQFALIIHYFILDRHADYNNYVYFLSLVFLLVQIGLLLGIMLIGRSRFYVTLENQLFKTKQYLDLINIDVLLENSYVMSFVKKVT